MKKILVMLATFVMLFAMGFAPANATPGPKNLRCDSVVSGGTYKNVTVNKGDSCTLVDVVLTGGFHAKKGSVNVSLRDTTVGHNIQVNGATGNVFIGNKNGCKYDPVVGNNVHVTNSHNVLICYVTSGNNIMVTRNDGKVTVRDSSAGNNLMVRNQKAFVADAGKPDHRNVDYVRILDSTYDNNFFSSNPDREKTVVRNVNQS